MKGVLLKRTSVVGALATLFFVAPALQAWAMPARIILLRHGEKASAYRLCETGERRSDALAQQYLGKGASQSLFKPGEQPAAILAITPHTLETSSPTALSWPMPVINYSVVRGVSPRDWYGAFGPRTTQAVEDMTHSAAWKGKTVIVVWDNTRIIQEKHPHYKSADMSVTLYNLLGLHALEGVPETWSDSNYNYFWIIDLDPETGKPLKFEMKKQVFTGAYADLPQNEWGTPNGLTATSGCALGRGSLPLSETDDEDRKKHR
ncbi:hypothetical protein ACT6QH_10400 [Xanthobacter sp. TB0139]|uniref:hypothetical protein n=1 Tax=Xanthobacter sp. TB0139 TaxID=3459178 RepID=UPI00403A5094